VINVAAGATGVIAAVGSLTLHGGFGRVQRTYGPWFALATALVVVGGATFGLAFLIDREVSIARLSRRGRDAFRVTAAVGVLVAVVLSIVAITGGVAETAAVWAGCGALCLGAVTVLAIGELFGNPSLRVTLREAVQVFATGLAAIGVVVALAVAISTAGDTESPTVALILGNDGDTASGTAAETDLGSRDRLTVIIKGLIRESDGTTYRPITLYQSFVGPNANGDATQNFRVPIPADQFDAIAVVASSTGHPSDCNTPITQQPLRHGGPGCAFVPLPPRPPSPELSASWEGPATSRILKVSMKADTAHTSTAGGSILLRATATQGGNAVPLYSATIPALNSTITQAVRLPLPAGVSQICLDAQYVHFYHPAIPATTTCGHRPDSTEAAVELWPPHTRPAKSGEIAR
jgi:hypothetical protein